MSLSQRVLGAVDLAIDFATLGEYGLEELELPAPSTAIDCSRRQRAGVRAARPPLIRARRRRCESTTAASASCLADAHVARR